mmetsp:Transcript_15574/g.33843  ORF Transcript_15574/g.33843 Transcript_15574/m.33843 type:complete len:340 (+) Transcript_15574:107-1126(+)
MWSRALSRTSAAARGGCLVRRALGATAATRSFGALASSAARRAVPVYAPPSGPEGPREEGATAGQPIWPSGWHDSLQYHFFFEGLFVHARVFLTPSLEEHCVWIYDHNVGKVEELISTGERLKEHGTDTLDLRGSRFSVHDGPGGGAVVLKDTSGKTELEVKFTNKHVYSWLPAGFSGSDAVIHRPDMDLELTFRGKELKGKGYSKRYYGEYGPHWGYRFIQSSHLPDNKFLWTADATFRIGEPEAKYNYFKLLDGETGELVQAPSVDTYQQDCAGYAYIDGVKYVAEIEPLGQWQHDYKGGDTNSRMQLRYCKLKLSKGDGSKPLEGYAFNERCFGAL